jgi:uncharacterized protein (TIGR02147 family)
MSNVPRPFHIEYLADELLRRIEKNPHYSLRSFARDLQVAAGWLSEVLRSKKGMSTKMAEKISARIDLTRQEKKLFVLSAEACHSRTSKNRQQAKKRLDALKVTKTFKMTSAAFVEAGAWYHQAILELTELEEFSHTAIEISQRLRLPLSTINRALKELQNVGLLEILDGRMFAVFPETESTMHKPSIAIKKYHERILEKAVRAVYEQSIHEREFLSATFAFDSSRITEAKDAIRKMQKQFTDEFYGPSEKKNSVYQISLQFFRIDYKGLDL